MKSFRYKVLPADFYPSILESIAEGIVVIGLDKKIIFVNKMAKELIGLTDEIAEGTACDTVIKTDLCHGSCPFNSMDSESSCSSHFMNINLYKRDDSQVPLCLNVASLHDADGNVVGIIENFRPMSEAVKIIESLEENNVVLAQEKSRIDSIINSLADGVFTVDKDLSIKSFNRGMEKLTGLKEQEVIGRSCSEILNSDNCAGECPLRYTLKNGYGLANRMERIAAADGRTIPVLISTAILREGPVKSGLIATIRDASEIEKLRKEVSDRYNFSNIIGKSEPIQQVFELIESLSDTDCAVLIEGESGTGKELVARAIHYESERRNKAFVKVNCSAIVEGLFESELFGHVRGSFTGAIKNKIGKFELADRGTLFLDEIGELPPASQSKLLRVIQDMEFERVGDNTTRKVDVRVIAATNKNLKHEIKAGNFREDLYYRLCIVPIKMPPLRERSEDIPLLVNHFLKKHALNNPGRDGTMGVTPAAISVLMDYYWPGNIRELENAIEHACIRSKTDMLDFESLPSSITGSPAQNTARTAAGGVHLSSDELEKARIKELLSKYNGNKTRIQKDLGISRTTLWRKLKRLNITT